MTFDTCSATPGLIAFVNQACAGADQGSNGHVCGGLRPGPVVVVSGFTALASPVYDRLLELSSLPFIRGTLLLVYTDRLGKTPRQFETIQAVDELLFLPFVEVDSADATDLAEAREEAYWTILSLCARLGMIAGRGIPPRYSGHLSDN